MENFSKPRIIKNLTPKVKLFSLGSQFQGFRCLRNTEGSTIYEIKSFPGPRKGFLLGLFGSEGDLALWSLESTEEAQIGRVGFEVATDPLQLYIRAHVLNQRLLQESWWVEENKLNWLWQFQGAKVLWQESDDFKWSVIIEREAQKTFKRQLRLGAFNTEELKSEKNIESKQEVFLQAKDERLLQRVQADIDESRQGLEKLQELCSYLEINPEDWGDRALVEWPEEVRNALLWMQSKGKVPSFQKAFRAEAFELFHKTRRRFQKKLLGSQKRMTDLLQIKEQGIHLGRNPSSKESQVVGKVTHEQRSRSMVGLWLTHPSGLKIRLGRNRLENAELYRLASSRDLWFHVRGLGGGHVWVPRGQPLWGAKDETLREDLRQWAAQVALYNSKGRSSGHGIVDFTEKRYLKSAKGEEGSLLIQRSQTQRVELDEKFEKELKMTF